jgi:hypothetical protein
MNSGALVRDIPQPYRFGGILRVDDRLGFGF